MTASHTEAHEAVTPGDLKALAAAHGPCLTAVVPLPDPAHIEMRIKNAIHGLEKKLAEQVTDRGTVTRLLAPIYELALKAEKAGIWAHALILFRSPGMFEYFLLHGQFKEAQAVDNRFHVRPLLRTLAHETRFHLLGLSQRNVRLLLCTQHRAEPLPALGFPSNLEAWLNNRQPDHVLASRSKAGPSVGRMKGVVSGTSTDRERQNENLHHFFKAVDRGVTSYLRGETGPLVLAGVEYEIAMYRRVNSYRPTLEQAVNGSPDGVPDRTMHDRAMEVISSTFSEPLQRVITTIRECVGTPRSSTDPRTVVQAAFQGRVLDLVIAANAEYFGVWNEDTQNVEAGHREELLNAAALQTIRQGGRAFVLDEQDMPVKAPAAAVFRY
jgi:hypothetical protein